MSKEQTALERIKDEVAKELCGIPDFNDLVHRYSRDRKVVPLNVVDEIAIRYARECCQAAIEEYKEKLKAVFLEEPNGTVNLGRFLKLIDSIK